MRALRTSVLFNAIGYAFSLYCLMLASTALGQNSTANESEIFAGKVIMVTGTVRAEDATGNARSLQRNSDIYTGDTLITDANSTAQLRMVDAAIVALRENTAFEIVAYDYNSDPTNDRSSVRLLNGGFRTITGLIGTQNKANYEAAIAEMGVIGIRGTDYEAVIGNDQQLVLGVWDGGITFTNNAGQLDLGLNANYDFGRVLNIETTPEGVDEQPDALGNIDVIDDNLQVQANPGATTTPPAASRRPINALGAVANTSPVATSIADTSTLDLSNDVFNSNELRGDGSINCATGSTACISATGFTSSAGDSIAVTANTVASTSDATSSNTITSSSNAADSNSGSGNVNQSTIDVTPTTTSNTVVASGNGNNAINNNDTASIDSSVAANSSVNTNTNSDNSTVGTASNSTASGNTGVSVDVAANGNDGVNVNTGGTIAGTTTNTDSTVSGSSTGTPVDDTSIAGGVAANTDTGGSTATGGNADAGTGTNTNTDTDADTDTDTDNESIADLIEEVVETAGDIVDSLLLTTPESSTETYAISWDKWNAPVEQNWVMMANINDEMVRLSTGDYFADVQSTPIANLQGTHSFATGIASSFLGRGSAGEINSLVATLDVDFNNGAISNGTLQLQVAHQDWLVQFDGAVNAGQVQLTATDGQLIDHHLGTTNSAEAALGGVFTGEHAEAFVGAFDIWEATNPLNQVEGLYTIER